MNVIALVGCGKSKLTVPAPAKDMYTGSLFRAARGWAERKADQWAILSAQYGLIEPDREIKPYSYRLAKKDAQQWGVCIVNNLRYRFGKGPFHLVLLAGVDYADPVAEEITKRMEFDGFANTCVISKPLAYLQLGERLAWFKKERLAETSRA